MHNERTAVTAATEIPNIPLMPCSIHGPADEVEIERLTRAGCLHHGTMLTVRCERCDEQLGWLFKESLLRFQDPEYRYTAGSGACTDAAIMAKMVRARHDYISTVVAVVAFLLATIVIPILFSVSVDLDNIRGEHHFLFGFIVGVLGLVVPYLTMTGIFAFQRRARSVDALSTTVNAMKVDANDQMNLAPCPTHGRPDTLRIEFHPEGGFRGRSCIISVRCGYDRTMLGWAMVESRIRFRGGIRYTSERTHSGTGVCDDSTVINRMVQAQRDFISSMSCIGWFMLTAAVPMLLFTNHTQVETLLSAIPVLGENILPIAFIVLMIGGGWIAYRCGRSIHRRRVPDERIKVGFSEEGWASGVVR